MLPATVEAQTVILVRQRIVFSNRNMTRILPATVEAQVATLTGPSIDTSRNVNLKKQTSEIIRYRR